MKKIILCALLAFSVALPSSAALAKNDKSQHAKHKNASHKNKDEATLTIAFKGSDRDIIKTYLKDSYGKKCPPGLAKKNNGCLPPGLAKKYALGQPLPEGVLGSSLPAELLKMIYPAPRGHKYVQVDKDILLIDQASRKVIDAITLFSAVGK